MPCHTVRFLLEWLQGTISMHGQNNNELGAAEDEAQRNLILRLRDWNDKRSWNEVYRIYHKLVYAVARQSGLSETEAWDVVQDTFITIARQSHGGNLYDPKRGSFKSWLLHITRWRINDQLRNRQQEASSLNEQPDPEDEGFDNLWEREWQQTLIRAAIAQVRRKVSPRQFLIFDYHVIRGMDAAKVCRKLGISATQVYLAKHRIGAQLRREINELRQQDG